MPPVVEPVPPPVPPPGPVVEIIPPPEPEPLLQELLNGLHGLQEGVANMQNNFNQHIDELQEGVANMQDNVNQLTNRIDDLTVTVEGLSNRIVAIEQWKANFD